LPSWPKVLAVALALAAIAWIASAITSVTADVDLGGLRHPYAIVFGFVVLDAVVPIFPSESLLNSGSVLATQDGSSLEIWRLIVAGAAGAVVGDSLLYWISRTALRSFMAERLEVAGRNEKVARTMSVFQDHAPVLIVFGRFVPGVRFAVGATMGLTRYSYPRFVLWNVVGGTSWAAFSCLSSALVATVVGEQPVVSLLVSALVTSLLLAFLYQRVAAEFQDDRASSDPNQANAQSGNS